MDVHPLDHALALILVLALPVRAVLALRRLQRAPLQQLHDARQRAYRDAITMQWALTFAVLGVWAALGRRWRDLGLVPAGEGRLGPLLLVLAALAVLIALFARARRQALRDDTALGALRERMRPLARILPHTPAEFRSFAMLAVTAGICEELLFRGFLQHYATRFLDPLTAAVVVAMVFGLGHAYQGVRGVWTTALFGLVLGAMVLATGSLFPAMLLHGLMDLHSGHLMMRAYQRGEEEESERLAAGWAGVESESRTAAQPFEPPVPPPGAGPPADA